MRNLFFRIASFASIFILTMMIAGCALQAGRSSALSPIYTMIIDAGSGGTRLSFYKVIPGNGGYPQITLLDNSAFKDNGINDFLMTPSTGSIKVGEWAKPRSGLPSNYQAQGCDIQGDPLAGGVVPNGSGGTSSVGPCVLQPLLDSMSQMMAKETVVPSQVKVELFATAGMRTMSYSNGGTKSDSQIAEFYKIMKDYVANVKGFSVGEFRTSDGNSEEGIWTWINLNDQYYNAFGGNYKFSKKLQPPVGDIEVGGSSMQIAFPVKPNFATGENVYPVTINGKTFAVFSKTFLGLGGDDMRKFMRASGYSSMDGGVSCFASTANTRNTVEPSGISLFYEQKIFPSVLEPVGNPSSNNATSTWTTNLGPTDFPMNWKLQKGAWDMGRCEKIYARIIDAVISLPRNASNSSVDILTYSYSKLKSAMETSAAPFVGLDGFYYTANDLGMSKPGEFDASKFKAAIDAKCKAGVAPFKGRSDSVVTQGLCSGGVYMNNFLFRVGGLFDQDGGSTFIGVKSPNDESGNSILGWPRGYLLKKYAN